MDLSSLGRILLVIAAVLAAVGLLAVLAAAVGLGHLPGDLSFRRGRVGVYIPIATSVVISIVLTVVLNLFFRR